MNSLLASSFSFSSSLASTAAATTTSAKPSQQLGGNAKRFKVVSCKAAPAARPPGDPTNNKSQSPGTNYNSRRNMLLGLGGLYGTANMVPTNPLSALAEEKVQASDFLKCGDSYLIIEEKKLGLGSCCPPEPSPDHQPTKYEFPVANELRIRPAAHLVDDVYIDKYTRAIQAMKDLSKRDPNDPWGFEQQAKIHCAYCNFGYKIKNKDGHEIEYQVHDSWLFFPFHRWYLYFFEKIAGKLIDDPTFALPYWNWDTPCGMTMPYMFVPAEISPLGANNDKIDNPAYSANRNQNHLPPAILDFGSSPAGTTDLQIICNNLAGLYRQMVTTGYSAEAFMGKPYNYGASYKSGSLEAGAHTAVHRWTGRPRDTNADPPNYGEDMANFYSAGRDPLFYAHHANVDRMWKIWKDELGGKDFNNSAWLESEFLFYDENKNHVKVSIADCLNEERMGYTYQPMELPWLKAKPVPRRNKGDVAENTKALTVARVFPATLDKVVKAKVQRSTINRSDEEKKKMEEVLVIEGIEYPMDDGVSFNVFINDEDGKGDVLSKIEFGSTFGSVAHGGGGEHGDASEGPSSFSVALNEILEGLNVEGDEYILVTLIPTSGGDKTRIKRIKIDYENKTTTSK